MIHDFEIPRVLDASLLRLRQRVRRYVLIEGLAIVVAIIGIGFWLSFGVDELHFQMRRLELPRWLRISFTIGFAVVVVLAFLTWVISRLWRSFGRRMLALILERRFPQLGDRLITAIELQGTPRAHGSPVSEAMFERTVAEAAIAVQNLDLQQVFDPRPLRRAVTVAAVVLASLVGISVANAAGVERWFQAFVLGKEDYWEPYRRSSMAIYVIAQPGEQVREFDANGVYKHPRGSDLTIEAVSAEGKPAPDKAVLSFRSFGANGSSQGSAPMSRRGERTFRQTLTRVIEEQHLWVTAGDFVNRMPLRVLIVEPPKIDSLQLKCDFPSYTGMDNVEDRPVPVQSVQASLPMETRFLLEGRTNKPLVSVLIRSEAFELRFDREHSGGSLTIRETPQTAAKTISITAGKRWILSDGSRFEVSFLISANGLERLAELKNGAPTPIPLPPVTPLQIYLEDEDGIFSTDPTLLTLSGIPDLDPVVDVRLSGVSNVVTRLAEIPVRGRITDDYGVVKAEFGYEIQSAAPENGAPVETAAKLQQTPLTNGPKGQKDFALGGEQNAERFALTPLALKDGQKLHLAVYAEDGDNLNGPHKAHGELFSFTIVPGEELLAKLYEKEVNLRQRFEQIIAETRRLRADLVEHREKTDEWNAAKAAPKTGADQDEKIRELLNRIDASARRSLHQIRTNHTESLAIEQAFGEIRAEMVNNRVDTESLLDRIDRGVVEPLHTINASDYPDVDGKLALFALAMERGDDPADRIDASREAVDRMLVRMEQVLSEMRRRGNINEIIQQLQSIIERQEKLLDATEQRKLDELFEGLGNP
jgi:hypothetical protein